MDAGIVDTLNRQAARMIGEHLDRFDIDLCANQDGPWWAVGLADTILESNASTAADRAWLAGILITTTPGLDLNSTPADFDWDNFYSHLRAEILARRNPKTPPVQGMPLVRDGVGSR